MLPENDRRHGSVAGYRAGCRNTCCRQAIARYNENWRLRNYRGQPTSNLVPAVGTQRRLQALVALGWSIRQLAIRLDMDAPFLRTILACNDRVATATAEKVAVIYEELSMTVPPQDTPGRRQGATRARNHARKRGWVLPLMWDDIDNDAEPINVTGKAMTREKFLDEIAVQRVLDGDDKIARYLSPAERREVVRRWPGSLNELERLTGWNAHRYTPGDAA